MNTVQAPAIEAQDDKDAVYKIGAVAQLTELPANTVRTWERRYGAVRPARTAAGGRLYSEADIERLQLLKALTEGGDAISVVASLPTARLRERLRASTTGAVKSPKGAVRLAVLHRTLGALVEEGEGDWTVVRDALLLDSFLEPSHDGAVEVMVLDLALLGGSPEEAFDRCAEAWSPALSIVTYDFAPRSVLESLADAGARLVRGPLETDQLARWVLEQPSGLSRRGPKADAGAPSEPAPPAYPDPVLARIRGLATTVECECPNHLARIVEMLVAFERYSASCAARSTEDAQLHDTLRRGTGLARADMEQLLALVLENEGIEITP